MKTAIAGTRTAAALVVLALALTANAGEAPWNPDERYFGTDAFVPDWTAAEEIDGKATERFLKDYWPKFKGDYDSGGAGTPAGVTAEEKAAGVVVFPLSYTQKVLPDYLPREGESRFASVSLFAAKGESEPMVIGVRTLDASKPVSIETSELVNGTSKLQVTQRLCLPYKCKEYAGNHKYRDALRPMVLLKTPNNTWTFPPNYTLVYVIDVHVPAAAKPGLHKGRVVVKAGDAVAKSIELEVEVLPFGLKTNNYHAGGFGTTFDIWAGGFTGYYAEMIELDSRYGFNLAGGFFNKGQEIPFRKAADGALEVDDAHEKFKKFQGTMDLLKKHGMGQVAFWNWGASGNVTQFDNVLKAAGVPGIATEAGKKGFAQICRAIKAAEKKYGWPEFVINPYDEALDDQDATREILNAMPLVQAASPETRIYMTEWHDGYARLYQSDGSTLKGKKRPPDNAKAGPSRFNFHVIGSNRLSDAGRKIQDELGGEYWVYTGINDVGPHARFAYGLLPYMVKAQACLIWATWKGDLTGEGWTLHFLMPEKPGDKQDTRGPALASVRAIGAREGIDDRKYIETLKFHARTKKSADDLKYLDELPARCRTLGGDLKNIGGIDNTESKVSNVDGFQKIRVELKDRILRLAEK